MPDERQRTVLYTNEVICLIKELADRLPAWIEPDKIYLGLEQEVLRLEANVLKLKAEVKNSGKQSNSASASCSS